ncbi:DUF2791 family P-loop domain-containing protein [Fusibacter paucivorans]|uniref:DUF2791 family P-loop domain-containing protein n=1 Tax=Fusibacter paucivorans TaxID=76009 RepID=A0ABS5PLZ5_9FIRM|nr:BREX system ATP-binding domain-containing protein [Fusibacter paucivorans]MBS7525616.1 DUF2791 family P-loop domain-containing protein [Fusibacter paucivorans]
MQSKAIINALRYGTPPAESSWQSFGRENEIRAFNTQLALIKDGASAVKLMLGDFGTGKSELISTLKRHALEKDYVIATLQIQDGFRFNKINDFYYAIMHNLSVKHHATGKASFNDLFEIWLNNLQHSPFPNQNRFEINAVCQALSQYNMNFARAFLSFMRARIQKNPEMQQVTTAWLTGERQIPYALKQKYGLTGFVDKTNTLDFLSAFCKLLTLLDYKGLVVFIDELDLIMDYRSDLRNAAFQNLKQLIDLGDLQHALFYFSGSKSLIEDADKGILSLPSLAQRLNYTNPAAFDGTNLTQPISCLTPLSSDQLKSLGIKIASIYREAYADNVSIDNTRMLHTIDSLVTAANTRQFVTSLIAHLDTCHHEDDAQMPSS